MSGIAAFVRLARPHFLLGGALLYGVGAAASSDVDPAGYVLGQAMVTSVQLTAHFVNEYADREVDRHVVNRTWFSGGSGVLSAGELRPQVAIQAAIVTSLLAVGCAVLVAERSSVAAALGVLALTVSWIYSIPPVRMLNTGWGEVVTSVVVAVLVPIVGALVNGGALAASLLWAVTVLFLVHVGMILAFELPDEATDRAARKTVLAVRIGPDRTRRLIGLCFASAAFVVGVAVARGAFARSLSLIPAGLAAVVVLVAAREQRFQLVTLAAVAVLALAALGLLCSV